MGESSRTEERKKEERKKEERERSRTEDKIIKNRNGKWTVQGINALQL